MPPKRDAAAGAGGVTYFINSPHYYGISGTTDGNGFANPAGSLRGCCDCCSGQEVNVGFISGVGMLVPTKGIRIGDVTDGTTNTITIGEASMFVLNVAGGSRTTVVNGAHGIMMGTPRLATVEGYLGNWQRCFNLTTVRFPPNAPVVVNDGNWPGVGDNFGSNNPLNSAHTGGVHALLTDGSTRFISDNIDMGTLRRLCSRNDGQVIGDF